MNTFCPACKQQSLAKIETINLAEQFRRYAEGNETTTKDMLDKSGLDIDSYDIYECVNCGLHFSDPMKAPSGEWYSYAYRELKLHASDRWEFDFVANTLTSKNKLAEIGCGTGVFLGKCKLKGADVYGIDFSETSVDACQKQGLNADLINIHAGEVKLAKSMDTIASFHVLEHLEDPTFLFRLASSFAEPSATLWVSVPSDRRIDRLLNEKHILDEPPHHLSKWTPKALGVIGQANGWHLKRIIDEELGIRDSLYVFCH